MRIALFGADGPTCQLDRIKQGFEELQPYFEVDMNPDVNNSFPYDLAYCNNPPFDKMMECHADIKIGNVLDIPEHLIESGQFKRNELIKLRDDLIKCNAITAISHTTKNQVKKYLNLNVNKVIYNPIKPVNKTVYKHINWQEREKLFLYVGRANDPNKRFNIIREALLLGYGDHPDIFKPQNVTVVGSENPNFGNYLGIVNDEELAELYKTHKFLLFPSKIEGIGLPMIEAILCGCKPITCNDNKCAKEFTNNRYSCDPSPESMVERILYEFTIDCDLGLYDYNNNFSIFQPKNVAKSILDVYNKLTKQ